MRQGESQFGGQQIPTGKLTANQLPKENADWAEIGQFALSFNGYRYRGSFDKCAEVANQSKELFGKHHRLSGSIITLRTCLFSEQRRWRHFGSCPDAEAMEYIWALVEEIRKRVKTKQVASTTVYAKDYRTDLNRRYWEYQRLRFPNWREHFERSYAQDGRPPVFLASEAWRNVIIDPNASQGEIGKLLALVPEPDRHKWFRSMNSSQALAQSVLGNLVAHGFLQYLAELADDEGNALLGTAHISSDDFAMEYKIDHLGEPRRTSLDGFVSGNCRIAIECKFTEAEVGTCSRPRLRSTTSNYESEHCDGTYSRQRAREERCSLTEVGVLYWRYVPRLFRWGFDIDLSPCPLNKNYQLVRNILAIGVRPDGTVSLEDGHVVLIYDERNPAFQARGAGLAAYRETRQALREPTMLRKCSWQRIIQHMRHRQLLSWLTVDVALKYGL